MVKISYNVVLQHTFSQWLVQWYHVDLHPVKWQMIQIRHYFIVLLGLKKVMGKSASESEVAQSCPTLCDPRLLRPWDFPGRVLKWVFPFPSPGDLPIPGIEPESPVLKANAFTVWATREVRVPRASGRKEQWELQSSSFIRRTLWPENTGL